LTDPRVEAYARLLVERSAAVQPGWQVLVAATPLARPLVEEIVRLIARRGAHPLTRIHFRSVALREQAFVEDAPLDLLGELAPLERRMVEEIDAAIGIEAPEDLRALGGVDVARLTESNRAMEPFMARLSSHEIPWVFCQFPTAALAEQAGLPLDAFADVLYGACLVDWDEVSVRMRRVADRLTAGREIRIVADGTDVRLSIDGRLARIDDGRTNLPGGEVFLCPLEDSAEGVVAFDRPNLVGGRDIRGIRLRFESGRVVEASAETGEEMLHKGLETDDGARRIGELGFGCNPGIDRYLGLILFDEKADGTVHLALGQGFSDLGGRNESSVHWDLVTDLRRGGRVELDGELVQESGVWL